MQENSLLYPQVLERVTEHQEGPHGRRARGVGSAKQEVGAPIGRRLPLLGPGWSTREKAREGVSLVSLTVTTSWSGAGGERMGPPITLMYLFVWVGAHSLCGAC